MKFSPRIGKLARATNAPGGSLLLADRRAGRALIISTNYVDDREPMNLVLSADANFQGLVHKNATPMWAWDVTDIVDVEVDPASATVGDDRPAFGSIACDKEGHRFIASDRPDSGIWNNWIDLEQFQRAAPAGGTTVRFAKWKLVLRKDQGQPLAVFNWPA